MKKILLIDDIEDYLDTLVGFLEDDFEIKKALSKKECMEILGKEIFYAAVIDIRLNDTDENNKDGLEILDWIKKNRPETKVVVTSAYKEFEYAVDAMQRGASFFMKKPIDPEKLRTILLGEQG